MNIFDFELWFYVYHIIYHFYFISFHSLISKNIMLIIINVIAFYAFLSFRQSHCIWLGCDGCSTKRRRSSASIQKESSKSQSSPLFATEAATGCSSTSIRTVTDWAFVLHSLADGGGRQHGKGKRSKKRHFRLEISFLFINMGNVHGCFD